MDIGLKIKEKRLTAGLTQEELGNRCELTKGYISQLENDLTSPSIATLQDILLALGTDLKEFFAESKGEEKVVFYKGDYFEKESTDHKITWLVPNSQKNEMEPILFELEPNSRADEDMPHEGEEFGYVLAGTITLVVGGKKYKANAGDSFYYSADKIHSIINTGAVKAKILWVSSPPNF